MRIYALRDDIRVPFAYPSLILAYFCLFYLISPVRTNLDVY